MNAKLLVALLVAAALSGCATPPGQLDDTDFVILSDVVPAPLAVTYRNFLEGLRCCGPETPRGLIMATHHGVPECLPQHPDGSVSCDLYVASPYGERSNYVLGRVDFAPVEAGTLATFRSEGWIGGKPRVIDAWRNFTVGQAGGVC